MTPHDPATIMEDLAIIGDLAAAVVLIGEGMEEGELTNESLALQRLGRLIVDKNHEVKKALGYE